MHDFGWIDNKQALRAITIVVPMAVTQVAALNVSVGRITRFLTAPDHKDRSLLSTDDAQRYAVVLRGATLRWPSKTQGAKETGTPMTSTTGSVEASIDRSNEDELVTVLEKVDLQVRAGSVTSIIGHVGSGKSTLLAAVVGDLIPTSGTVQSTSASVGYVPQRPWILSGTVRENVLFGRPLNKAAFDFVCDAADLGEFIKADKDGNLPDGLNTEIGERGATLSGGQQQRVSIARALYGLITTDTEDDQCTAAQGGLLIMDDPLSAVDARVRNFARGLS
eukprot:SAG31_NODE_3790_length_3878_cov_1.766931_3_plen_278_part_00